MEEEEEYRKTDHKIENKTQNKRQGNQIKYNKQKKKALSLRGKKKQDKNIHKRKKN